MIKLPVWHICSDAIEKYMQQKNWQLALVVLTEISSETVSLSRANQLNMVLCLYHLKRYFAALEKSRRFIESGNNTPELLFLSGLCYYQSRQYANALEVFRMQPEWARWVKKAEVRKDQNTSKAFTVTIGDIPSKADDEKAEFTYVDSSKSLLISLPLEGVDVADLKVTIGPTWIDVTYDDGLRKIAKSLELYDKVVPKSKCVRVLPTGLKIEISKEVEGEWPSLSRPEDATIIDADFDDVVTKMDIIPTYTDEVASEMYEKSVKTLKEEGISISSWFMD
jgi:hypothetical protein